MSTHDESVIRAVAQIKQDAERHEARAARATNGEPITPEDLAHLAAEIRKRAGFSS